MVEEVRPHALADTQHLPSAKTEAERIEESAPALKSARAILALISLAISYEASVFSLVLPASVLTYINADVGPNPIYPWVTIAWTLSASATQTTMGRLSDIFGRRWIIQLGNLLGLIGTIIAARAATIYMVIVGTTFMGIGAGCQGLAYGCIAEIVPKNERGIVNAYFTLAAIPGGVFGTVIAYAMIKTLSWRWTFILGIILNGLGLLAVAVLYHPPNFRILHPDGSTRWQQVKKIDHVASLLFTSGLVLFLLGISWGGIYSWATAIVVAPLTIGGILIFVILPAWEIRFCPKNIDPLFPAEIFNNFRGFTFVLVTYIVASMSYFFLQTWWPQQIYFLFTQDPSTIGWLSMSLGAGIVVGGVSGGSLWARIGHTKWQFVFAAITQSIAIGCMATVDVNGRARGVALVAVTGVAVGWVWIFGLLSMQLTAKDEKIGIVTGLVGSCRGVGGSLAQAIYGSIFNNWVRAHYAGDVGTAIINAGLPIADVQEFMVALQVGTPEAFASIDGVTPQILSTVETAVKDVYTGAFRTMYLVTIGFSLVAVISALCTSSVDHLLTRQVAVKLDRAHVFRKGENEAKVYSLASKEVV